VRGVLVILGDRRVGPAAVSGVGFEGLDVGARSRPDRSRRRCRPRDRAVPRPATLPRGAPPTRCGRTDPLTRLQCSSPWRRRRVPAREATGWCASARSIVWPSPIEPTPAACAPPGRRPWISRRGRNHVAQGPVNRSWIVAPDLFPNRLRKSRERQQVRPCRVEALGDLR